MIVPEGKLVLYTPIKDGYISKFGHGWDYRNGENVIKSQDGAKTPGWSLTGCEFIEPLKAIAPRGALLPQDMTLGSTSGKWAAGDNTAFRETVIAGNPAVKFLEFYDGSVHQDTEALTDYSGSLLYTGNRYPRGIVTLIRCSPPAGQEVRASIAISIPCEKYNGSTWDAGYFTLVLPNNDATYTAPFIHEILSSEFTGKVDVLAQGRILAKGPAASAQKQGQWREQWVIEYEDDATNFAGGHILIRNSDNMEEYWHYYSRNLRLTTGAWSVSVQGAVTAINISPISYGGASMMTAYPQGEFIFPSDADFEQVRTLGTVNSARTNWTVTATESDSTHLEAYSTSTTYGVGAIVHDNAAYPDRQAYRSIQAANTNNALTEAAWWEAYNGASYDDLYNPADTRLRVVFARTNSANWYERPVLWNTYEESAYTISGASATSVDTDAAAMLESIEYTLNDDWRGATGSAKFGTQATALYPTLAENAKVEVYMGWDDSASASLRSTKVATCYIAPGGIQRYKNTDMYGLPSMSLSLCDFTTSRLGRTCILFQRQAAGQTITGWFTSCANAMGLPDAMVDVAAGIASTVIPLSEVPGEATFAPKPGDSWQDHLDSVCNALGYRWGVDKDGSGKLFIDAGRPVYEDGVSTIALEIDHDTLTMENVAYEIGIDRDFGKYRNMVFVNRQDMEAGWASWSDMSAEGVLFAHYSAQANAGDLSASATMIYNELHRGQATLKVTMPLRVDLRPDMFVQVVDCPEIGITANSVYQITEHKMRGGFNGNSSEAESQLTMRFVAVPVEEE